MPIEAIPSPRPSPPRHYVAVSVESKVEQSTTIYNESLSYFEGPPRHIPPRTWIISLILAGLFATTCNHLFAKFFPPAVPPVHASNELIKFFRRWQFRRWSVVFKRSVLDEFLEFVFERCSLKAKLQITFLDIYRYKFFFLIS